MLNRVSRTFYRLIMPLGVALLTLTLMLQQGFIVNAAPYDWLQFGFDQQHSGNNTMETNITVANVSNLKQLFQVQLPANTIPPNIANVADNAPAYLSGVSIGGNPKDMLFLTTRPGDVLALDAHTGDVIWRHQNGVPLCVDSTPAPCITTASPAIDPNRSFVYSYGLDGKVHKYHVDTGEEVTTGGWPEVTTVKPTLEKGSGSMAIGGQPPAATYLYMPNGGYIGDHGDYQGHLTTINLATGAQNVFNTLCGNQTVHLTTRPDSPSCDTDESAVWARPGSIYDQDTGKVYIVTGNGDFDPSKFNWGDSVLAIHLDGTGAAQGNPLDSYTPTNQQDLDNTDADLGSTAPAILPANNGHHYGVQSGKDQVVRIINLDDLSGKGQIGQTRGEISTSKVPQGGRVLTQPAVWTNPKDKKVWVFIGNGSGLSGLALNSAGSDWDSSSTWSETDHSCSSPIIANGVLFCSGSSYVQAVDPTTGKELWHDTGIGGIHWESPIVANGILYITDEDQHLSAYGLAK